MKVRKNRKSSGFHSFTPNAVRQRKHFHFATIEPQRIISSRKVVTVSIFHYFTFSFTNWSICTKIIFEKLSASFSHISLDRMQRISSKSKKSQIKRKTEKIFTPHKIIAWKKILFDDCVNHRNYRIKFPFHNWKPFHSHITTSTVKKNTWDK